MRSVTVNLSFPDLLLRDIDRAARGEARSRSDLVREAARAYLARRDRWHDLFAAGRRIARQQRLAPADVATEIRAFRSGTRRRP